MLDKKKVYHVVWSILPNKVYHVVWSILPNKVYHVVWSILPNMRRYNKIHVAATMRLTEKEFDKIMKVLERYPSISY